MSTGMSTPSVFWLTTSILPCAFGRSSPGSGTPPLPEGRWQIPSQGGLKHSGHFRGCPCNWCRATGGCCCGVG
eukprot:10075922-Prorocentrum_lima.AAC.1